MARPDVGGLLASLSELTAKLQVISSAAALTQVWLLESGESVDDLARLSTGGPCRLHAPGGSTDSCTCLRFLAAWI